MRQLLDFLKIGRRDKNDPSNTDDALKTSTDSAKTPTDADESVSREQPAPAASQSADSNPNHAAKTSLADVLQSRRRYRWQPPDLEGPEFGGLI